MFNKKISSLIIGSLGACSIFLSQQALALPSHTTDTWQDIAGISWSTDQVNWGNDDVYVGETVYFKFDMHKSNQGNHYADLLKAWIDLDQDGTYEQDESFVFSNIVHRSPVQYDTPEVAVDETYSFLTRGYTFTDLNLGEISMLVRVTCTESILATSSMATHSWEDQWSFTLGQYDVLFTPDKALHQGEAEERTFAVRTPSDPPGPSPVPEPTALLLFGTGLIGLAGVARRKK